MKRKIGIFLSIILILTGFRNPVSAKGMQELPEELEQLYARSAVLMDADSGRVLIEKNGREVMPMASTTKIMTCILALENGNEEDIVSVSERAVSQPKVHLGAGEGEEFRLEDLLYSLMLESHNDTAVMIAEHVAGSVENFAKMMNEKAEEIGCTNTHFVTPNGLDETDEGGAHSTTAEDMALIMRYCITGAPEKEEFLTITQTKNHTFQNVGGTRSYSCVNHNAFLGMMDGALTGKTGFTSAAGYCYVGALKRDGRTFVVALLACGWPNNKSYKWSDTRKLMEYGLAHYEYREIPGTFVLNDVPVEDGIAEDGGLYSAARAEARIRETEGLQLLLSPEEKVSIRVTIRKKLQAPVEENEVIGRVEYFLEEEKIAESEIIAAEKVEKTDYKWYFSKIVESFLSFV